MKKKYYILVGLITCMFMFFPLSGVKADVNTMMCEYYDNMNDRKVAIYYNTDTTDYFIQYYETDWLNSDGYTGFKNKYTYISPSAEESLFIGAKCPKRAFFDVDGNKEFCFDNADGKDKGFCMGDKDLETDELLPLKHKGLDVAYKTSLNKLNGYFDHYIDANGKLTISGRSFCAGVYGSNKTDESKKRSYNNVLYFGAEDAYNTYIGKKFPSKITTESVKQEMLDGYSKALKESESLEKVTNACHQLIDEDLASGKITEQEAEKEKEKLTKENLYDEEYVRERLENILPDVYIENGHIYTGKYYCGIFGEGSFKIVKDVFGIVKILIPAIIILLGMADFLKVVFSGEEKDMKTAGMRLVKRLIIGIIFILLPVLLGFIFDIVGFSENCLGQLI